MLISWLIEIVGFSPKETLVAREVPFMHSIDTNKPAGKIDIVICRETANNIEWYGLEIQAVYFSGPGMEIDIDPLQNDLNKIPPFPIGQRRPDWRSSGAKRLLPQLEIKVPLLRRWGSKMAVAVDKPFFESISPTREASNREAPKQDIAEGDLIWMVPKLTRTDDHDFKLVRGHWEALTLEDSIKKLQAAEPIRKFEFERTLRAKCNPFQNRDS